MADRVLVRHVRGGEKFVAADRVEFLSPQWSVVDPQPEAPAAPPEKKKRSDKKSDESTPAVVPDNDSQEG